MGFMRVTEFYLTTNHQYVEKRLLLEKLQEQHQK